MTPKQLLELFGNAESDPEQARKLWEAVLTNSVQNDETRWFFQSLMESVFIDMIAARMQADQNALAMGYRMVTLLQVMGHERAEAELPIQRPNSA